MRKKELKKPLCLFWSQWSCSSKTCFEKGGRACVRVWQTVITREESRVCVNVWVKPLEDFGSSFCKILMESFRSVGCWVIMRVACYLVLCWDNSMTSEVVRLRIYSIWEIDPMVLSYQGWWSVTWSDEKPNMYIQVTQKSLRYYQATNIFGLTLPGFEISEISPWVKVVAESHAENWGCYIILH